jgi:hypothetical protein
MARLDDLWRAAGGRTRAFNLAAFRALIDQASEVTAPPNCPDCTMRSPDQCWFTAVGATVKRQGEIQRRRRPACRQSPGQIALFGVDEVS